MAVTQWCERSQQRCSCSGGTEERLEGQCREGETEMGLCDCVRVFSMEKEGPSRIRGHGDAEAAQWRMSWCGESCGR